MFGIRIINFCCSGVISCGKPQWLLQEQWLDQALVQNDAHTHSYQRVKSKTKCLRWLRHSLIHSDSCRVWSSVWGFGCWDGTLPLVCPTKSPGPLKNSFTATDVFTSKQNSNTQRKQTQDHTCLCMRLYRCPFVSVPWKKTLWLPVWDLCAFVVWCYGRGTAWSKITGYW